MKPVNNTVLSQLDDLQGTSGSLPTRANLYTFTLANGTVYTLTDGDGPTTINRPAFPGDPGAGLVTFQAGGPGQLLTATLAMGGNGYAAGDILQVAGGTDGFIQVLSTGAGGAVSTYKLVMSGAGYVSGLAVATTGGKGLGAAFNITAAAIAPVPDAGGLALKWGLGTEVDSCQFRLVNSAQTSAMLSQFALGLFDNATVQLERVFGSGSLGTIPLLLGFIGDITRISRIDVEFEVRDIRQILNMPMPHRVYMPSCTWPLYGTGCTLLKGAFGITGSVIAGSSKLQVFTNQTNVTGYFSEGTVKFTSGLNSGTEVAVRASVAGAVATATMTNGGGSYSQNDVLTLSQGSATLGLIQVLTVSGGAIQTYALANNGSGYVSANGVGVTGGTGHSATFNITAGQLLTMFLPLANIPIAGDAVTAYPGCDHTQATCTNKFNNLTNFGGAPFIPVPETAV